MKQPKKTKKRAGLSSLMITWLSEDILLDGHHRYEICQQHNITFDVDPIDLPDREAAIDWIMRNQLGRRNLTADEYRYYIGKLYEGRKHQGQRTDLKELPAKFAGSLDTAVLHDTPGPSRNRLRVKPG